MATNNNGTHIPDTTAKFFFSTNFNKLKLPYDQDKGQLKTTGLVTTVDKISKNITNYSGDFSVDQNNFTNNKITSIDGYDKKGVITKFSISTSTQGYNAKTVLDAVSAGDNATFFTEIFEGNDSIIGSTKNDLLNGYTGNDTITGGDGNDSIDGGTGNDSIDGGLGNDSIDGGVGDDIISGNDGNDTIDGGAGNDNIDGGLGNDTVFFSGKSTEYTLATLNDGSIEVKNKTTGETEVLTHVEKLQYSDKTDTLNKIPTPPPLPTLTLTKNSGNINETTNNSVTYTATLSSPATSDLSIPYTLSGDGITTSDFTGLTDLSGKIKIETGKSYGELQLFTTADVTTEGLETVLITLDTVDGVHLGEKTASTVIIDTSITLPTVNLSSNAASVNETTSNNSVTYTAKLTGGVAPAGGLNIPYTLTGAGITPDDFIGLNPLTGNINISENSPTGTLTLLIAADAKTEGDEALNVTLGNSTGVILGAVPTVPTKIIDTSKTPIPNVTLSSIAEVNEGVTDAVIYTATLSSKATTALSIPYTLDGSSTATINEDYTVSAKTINIAVGEDKGTLKLTTKDDSKTEGVETVSITLGAVDGVNLGGKVTASTVIVDTSIDAPIIVIPPIVIPPIIVIPTVTLASTSTNIDETGFNNLFTYRVNLSSAATSELKIPYTLSGPGIEPGDFIGLTTLNGFFNVPAGGTTSNFVTLTTTADTKLEGDENLLIILETGTGFNLGATNTSMTTIIKDTSTSVPVIPLVVPTVTLSANATSVNETAPNNTVTYTATLTGGVAPAGGLKIPYVLGGSATAADYSVNPAGTINIEAGKDTGTLALTTVLDAKTEGVETVSIALKNTVAGVNVNEKPVPTLIADTSLNTSTGKNITLLPGGTVEASAFDDIFKLATATVGYDTTVKGFDYLHDKIQVPVGSTFPSAIAGGVNNVNNDGTVDLIWSSNLNVITIHFIGIDATTEAAVTLNSVPIIYGTY